MMVVVTIPAMMPGVDDGDDDYGDIDDGDSADDADDGDAGYVDNVDDYDDDDGYDYYDDANGVVTVSNYANATCTDNIGANVDYVGDSGEDTYDATVDDDAGGNCDGDAGEGGDDYAACYAAVTYGDAPVVYAVNTGDCDDKGDGGNCADGDDGYVDYCYYDGDNGTADSTIMSMLTIMVMWMMMVTLMVMLLINH